MSDRTNVGFWCGIGAYFMWGVFPFYFKAVTAGTDAWEVLAHRIVWAIPVLAALLALRGRLRSTFAIFFDPRLRRTLALTAVLIAANWLLFIYAIATGRTLQASLGYFINPLISVFLGVYILRERLSRWQTVSIVLAACGVVYLTTAGKEFPWISLTLAFSFAFYGLFRKQAPVDSASGLFVETVLLAPLALGFLVWKGWNHELAFGHSLWNDGLLIVGGPLTTAPLVLFTMAARRLPLATIGFLQYLAPSLQFSIAVFAFGEEFDRAKAVAFGVIWMALAIFLVDTVRRTATASAPKSENSD